MKVFIVIVSLFTTLLMLSSYKLNTELTLGGSQQYNYNISPDYINHNVLHNTCDSIPVTFQKIIDLTEYEDFTQKLLRYPNGDYLAIGHTGLNNVTSDGFIMKFDSLGRVHWAKRVGLHSEYFENFPNVAYDYPERISEGIILQDSIAILTGYQIRERGSRFSFVVAVDFDGNKLWDQELPQKIDSLLYQRLRFILKTDSDRIFLSGDFGSSLLTFSLPGYLYEIDNQGNFIQAKGFLSTGGANKATSISEMDGNLFFNPTVTIPGPVANQQIGFGNIKTDSNLNLLESKRLVSNIDSLRLQFVLQSTFEKDSFLFISHMVGPKEMLVSADKGQAGLIKYNILSNEIVYSKLFLDTLGADISMGRDFQIYEDGSVLMTFANTTTYLDYNNSTPEDNIVLIKISPHGEIIWRHTYGGTDSDPYAYMSEGQNGSVQLAGTSYSFGTQQSGMYLIHTDSMGLAGECNQQPSGIISEDYPLTVSDVEVWTDSFPYQFDSVAILPFQSLYPVAKDLCCDDLADAAIQFFHPAYPCGDSVGVAVSICNVGTAHLPDDYPVSIYDQNPANESIAPLLTFSIGEIIPGDTCLLFSKTLLKTSENKYYVVLGDPGNGASPYEIACDFPLTTTEECDYYNNVSSVDIPNDIGIVGLDDDYYLVCPAGQEHALDLVAPPYFSNPIWNSAFVTDVMTDTLRAYKPGWYYLEATTPCGNIFIDSVEVISRFPLINLSVEDTIVCQYDTLILYSPSGHKPLRWDISPSQGVYHTCRNSSIRCSTDTIIIREPGNYRVIVREAPALNCQVRDTVTIHVRPASLTTIDSLLCPGTHSIKNQTFSLTTDTLLQFNYPFSEFCDSTIQYQISILDTSYQEVNLQACSGDSALFDNTLIAAGDNRTFIKTKSNGCDSTIFVSVQALPPSPTTEIFLDFCTGDSLLLFGNYEQASGIYSNTFTNTNGCDSLVQITLTEQPIFQTQNLRTICSGQSTVVHGQPETQAGFYEAIFTAQNGCDSFSFIELQLYETVVLNATIMPSCPDEMDGSIALSVTAGDGPFIFEWADELVTDSLRTDLAAGTYALTVTDVNGCASLYTYDVLATVEANCNLPQRQWYAPNAFSPNDDGRNDRFTFYGNEEMDQIEVLEIFDRRGSLVFRVEHISFNDETLGWDGRLKGKLMNPQVFVWRAVLVDREGVREAAEGDVTLMR